MCCLVTLYRRSPSIAYRVMLKGIDNAIDEVITVEEARSAQIYTVHVHKIRCPTHYSEKARGNLFFFCTCQ